MRSFILSLGRLCAFAASGQSYERMVSRGTGELPQWVQLMYAPDADPGAVQAAYDAYYAANPFVKNIHTQYFKRWKRELGRRTELDDRRTDSTWPIEGPY